jgi:hypothetical protein
MRRPRKPIIRSERHWRRFFFLKCCEGTFVNASASLSVKYMKTVIMLCLAGTLSCRFGSLSNVRQHAHREECRSNLKRIGAALIDYTLRHGKLPNSHNGDASIAESLQDSDVQKKLGIDSAVLRCPADASSMRSSYIFNPVLTANDFGSDSTTVVACDRQPFHPSSLSPADSPVAVILLGSGAVTTLYLTPKSWDSWERLFLSGDPRACKYAPDGKVYTGVDLVE